jgi:hypothetical protein
MVYVATALTLAVTLIPAYGLTGAALASTLSAFAHQTTIAFVLKRHLGFRIPMRAYVAWGVSAAACVVALWVDPGRLAATGFYVMFLGAFVVLGRVSASEITRLWKSLFRRR